MTKIDSYPVQYDVHDGGGSVALVLVHLTAAESWGNHHGVRKRILYDWQ